MNTLVFLTGTGGTGKTTAAAALESLHGFTGFQSVTREYYHLAGLKTEQDLLKLTEVERLNFQIDLLNFSLRRMKEFIQAKEGLIVLDRSPTCYLAYLLLHGINTLTQEVFENLIQVVRAWFLELGMHGYSPLVFYAPYPVPWREGVVDSFRHVSYGKDATINAIIVWIMQQMSDVVFPYSLENYDTVQERVDMITGVVAAHALSLSTNSIIPNVRPPKPNHE